jgi:hypothetical protein
VKDVVMNVLDVRNRIPARSCFQSMLAVSGSAVHSRANAAGPVKQIMSPWSHFMDVSTRAALAVALAGSDRAESGGVGTKKTSAGGHGAAIHSRLHHCSSTPAFLTSLAYLSSSLRKYWAAAAGLPGLMVLPCSAMVGMSGAGLVVDHQRRELPQALAPARVLDCPACSLCGYFLSPS